MEHHGVSLLTDIAYGIIFATILSHLARILKQPLILGYVLGGVILGKEIGLGLVTSEDSIELISEIGLILLLFIIGLEINLSELAKMGKTMFTLGCIQFFFCLGISILCFQYYSFNFEKTNFTILYIGIALSLSSTLIVVKLLQDKLEISTVSGKLTIGVLVLQDIWAILFMGLQPNLLNPEIVLILNSILIIIVLIISSFATSRYILKRIFASSANRPELILLTSISWCFFVTGLAQKFGLSKEMGALVAGMSIAAFPYGADVISKLTGIRDFFVTLFFVSLGLKIKSPNLEIILFSFLAVFVVLLNRLITITPVVYFFRTGLRNGIVTAINLSQISEFALVIIALGENYKHVHSTLQAYILNATILASIFSTYFIKFNHQIAGAMINLLSKFGISDTVDTVREDDDEIKRDIILLGYFRIATLFLDHVSDLSPSLTKRITVVDYNPANKTRLEKMGFDWHYADLAHPDTLSHLGVENASFIICSVSDIFLKGTTNLRLLKNLKQLAPDAKCIMTADEISEKKKLLNEGAYKVMVPGQITGEFLFDTIMDSIRKI
jgi:Kef-type K+ transport system membrane component KefB